MRNVSNSRNRLTSCSKGSLACLLAGVFLQTAVAGEAIPPGECSVFQLDCDQAGDDPTVREQLRHRRLRRIDGPRLDRPDLPEPRYGQPGFHVVRPGEAIGR